MSTIIPINERYQIELDDGNWIVAKWKICTNHPAGGKWVGVSDHRTLQQAGESLLLRFVSDEELSGVQEVCNALQSASTHIARAIVESGFSALENQV